MVRWISMCGLLLGAWMLSAQADVAGATECRGSALDVEARRLMGGDEQLCEQYGGQVVLVVNTASHCGFTRQFGGLQSLYEEYREQGLVVLGFPSGDFAGQEFGEEEEIAEFCQINYGVSFPMFGKTQVKGEDAHPLFARLTEESGKAPRWNFHKYLLGRDGKVIAEYSSRIRPDSRRVKADVEAALGG